MINFQVSEPALAELKELIAKYEQKYDVVRVRIGGRS